MSILLKSFFAKEDDSRVEELRTRLDEFYATRAEKEYQDFQSTSSKERFWAPVKKAINRCLSSKSVCRVLEFGAGYSGFASSIEDLEGQVIFDAQDVTALNQQHLENTANKVFIGPIESIDERYDVIFSTFVWEHITNPKKVLQHLLSLLNPGGRLIITCPRYDFPGYLSPSAKHLSFFRRCCLSVLLMFERLKVLVTRKPSFLIHLDPALFHLPWFRDTDAVHWVSFWDLKFSLDADYKLYRIPLSDCHSLKERFWAKFCLLVVEVRKLS